MKYLKISNGVEIEPNAFHLIGACTKRDDSSKIGYFGSGLKYAIAVLLRENAGFAVYSGKKKIKITHKPDTLRDKEFDVIYIDGQKTSMTTSMGPEWKMWQAIREIYCNALDEPDCKLEQTDTFKPQKGETAFYFCLHDNEELQKIIDEWDRFFAHKRPTVVSCDKGQVYNPYCGKMAIYRKHIRCYDTHYGSLYDYDLDDIQINESRLICSSYDLCVKILDLWKSHAKPQMIEKLLGVYDKKSPKESRENLFEHSAMEWNYGCNTRYNEAWIECLRGKLLVPYESAGWFIDAAEEPNAVLLPATLIRQLKGCFGDEIKTAYVDFDDCGNYAIVKPNERQQFLISEVKKFCAEVKLEINYPVVVGEFKSPKIMGVAHNESIVVSTKTFDLGKKAIVNTIIEEHMHLDSKQGDKTRGFQDYLINQMVTMLENQYGVFL